MGYSFPAKAPYLTPHPSCLADAPKAVEILPSPSEENIRPGDLVTLTCRVNSSYPPVSSVQWLKDGTPLKSQSLVLQLPQAAWDDAGVYTCQAGNEVGSLVSPPFSLHIFSESWVNLGLDQRVGKGSRPQGLRRARSRCLLRQMTNLPGRVGCQEGPRDQDRHSRLHCRRV